MRRHQHEPLWSLPPSAQTCSQSGPAGSFLSLVGSSPASGVPGRVMSFGGAPSTPPFPPPTLLGLPGPPGRATGRRVRRVRCGSARASSQGFLLGCSWALPAFGKSPKPRSRGEPTIAEAHAASCPHTATCNALCPGFWFPAVSRCLLFLLSKIMSSPGNLRSSRPLGACCLAGAFLLSSPG